MRLLRSYLLMLTVMVLPAVSMADVENYEFKVFLDEREIGHHRFVVSPRDMRTFVSSEARFEVSFLFLNFYRYLHSSNEVWQNDCLREIKSRTNDNGEIHFVRGQYSDDSFLLETVEQRMQVDGCVRTFAYWNPALLSSGQLLNPQTGELIEVEIAFIGESAVRHGEGSSGARHYQITGDGLTIDLWYSKDEKWLALESTVETGARLRYAIQ